MDRIYVSAPDDPEGRDLEFAPEWVTRAIQRRLGYRPVAVHPTERNVFIFDPGNFWDGPTHVMWEPECGMFVFEGWSGMVIFPLIGPLR